MSRTEEFWGPTEDQVRSVERWLRGMRGALLDEPVPDSLITALLLLDAELDMWARNTMVELSECPACHTQARLCDSGTCAMCCMICTPRESCCG